MGWCAVDGADRIHRPFCFVLEDALLASWIQVTPDLPTLARDGMAISRPSGSATLVNA